MSAGTPWTHKNQGQKIMFGKPAETLFSFHSGFDLTSQVQAGCKAPLAILPIIQGPALVQGLSSYWVTGAGEVIYKSTLNTQPFDIVYKGRNYTLPSNLRVLDVNAYRGRIWAVYEDGSNGISVATCAVGGTFSVIHQYTLPTGLTINPRALLPAFSKDCSTLTMGWSTDPRFDIPSVPVRTLTLNPEGLVASVADSSWAVGLSHYSGSYTNIDPDPLPDVPTSMPVPNKAVINPDMTLAEITWNPAASSGIEHILSANPAGGAMPTTLDGLVSNYIGMPATPVNGGWGFDHYELVDGPSTFSNTYPPEYDYQNTSFTYPGYSTPVVGSPPCFTRVAKLREVRYLRDSSGNITNTSTVDIIISSGRVGRHFVARTIGGVGAVSSGTSTFGYTGEKPMGWVRNVTTGSVDPIVFRETQAGSESATFLGTHNGSRVICQLFGTGVNLEEAQLAYDMLPTPQGYSCTAGGAINSPNKEGLYIGNEFQFETYVANDPYSPFGTQTRVTVEEHFSTAYVGTYTMRERPTSGASYPAGSWPEISNATVNNVITPDNAPWKRVSFGWVVVDYRARVFVSVENYDPALINFNNQPTNSATYMRTRKVFKNGVLIYSDDFQAATNGYARSIPKAADDAEHISTFAYIAPFGKKGQLKFMIGVYDGHGFGRNSSFTIPHHYWGDAANVTPNSYQILLDSDGNTYSSIPTETGSISIGPGLNSELQFPDHVVLNVRV